jgi:predicted lipoprotein
MGLALALALLPMGCKIVPKAAETTGDPDAALIATKVEETFETQLRPLVAQKAVEAAGILPLGDLAATGAVKGAGAGGSWTLALKGQGIVTEENRKSRAGKVMLDINADGKTDLTLQMGPVVKGTALRDIAPFYDFTAFRDQIQFAALGRALNDRAVAGLSLPEGLVGKTIAFEGVFQVQKASDPVLVVALTAVVK